MQRVDAPDALQAAIDRLFRRTAHGIRPGLEIIGRLLAWMDCPERSCPGIHVAGTNGKGSVCAMIESILRHAGYRTGLYTSPHLVRFNERICVGGDVIPDEALARWINLIEPLAETVALEPDGRPATFFEFATAIAFGYFKSTAVDWAVLETGMGGRWDATNVCHPACTVITPVDIDHTSFLGKDIRGIAAEKAGIIKTGVPTVCGDLRAEAMAVVAETARKAGSPLFHAAERVQVERLAQRVTGQKIRVTTENRTLSPVWLPFIGRHQLGNVGMAVAACEVLAGQGRIELTDEALHKGLSECRRPARAQVLEMDPIVLLDVAHNPHGAAALSRTLSDVAGDQPVGMIVSFLKDKDAAGCLGAFAKVADRFWVTEIEDERAMPTSEIERYATDTGKPVQTASLEEARAAARDWARAQNGIVCIAGSLYLAGAVLQGRSF